MPLSLGVAIFLTEFAPDADPPAGRLPHRAARRDPERGLRALGHLRPDPVPARHASSRSLKDALGFLPFFQGPIYGPSMLVGRHHPRDHGHAVHHVGVARGAARGAGQPARGGAGARRHALGGGDRPRWCPTPAPASSARSSSGLGRALGETMAVTMLIGNRHEIAASLFAPGLHHGGGDRQRVLRGGDADMHLSALTLRGASLFVVTVLVNAGARLLIWRVARGSGAGSTAPDEPPRASAACMSNVMVGVLMVAAVLAGRAAAALHPRHPARSRAPAASRSTSSPRCRRPRARPAAAWPTPSSARC